MLFEVKTTACLPSTMGRVLAAGTEASGKAQSGRKLEGAWVTELGTLARLVELRSLAASDVAASSPGLAQAYPELRDAITGTETSLLAPVLPLQPASNKPNIYEWRRYRVRPGHIEEWVKNFAAVMPARERHSARVGLWRFVSGPVDEVSHLWVYESLDQRAAIRAKVAQDPDWQAFLKIGSALLTEMHSTILMPTAYSPMQ